MVASTTGAGTGDKAALVRWRRRGTVAFALCVGLTVGALLRRHRERVGVDVDARSFVRAKGADGRTMPDAVAWQSWNPRDATETAQWRSSEGSWQPHTIGPVRWEFACHDEPQPDPLAYCRMAPGHAGNCGLEPYPEPVRVCLAWGPLTCVDGVDFRTDSAGAWEYRCTHNGSAVVAGRARWSFPLPHLAPSWLLLALAAVVLWRGRRAEGLAPPWQHATRVGDHRARLHDGRLVALDSSAPPGEALQVIPAEAVSLGYREGDVLRAADVRADSPALREAAERARSTRRWQASLALSVGALVALAAALGLDRVFD